MTPLIARSLTFKLPCTFVRLYPFNGLPVTALPLFSSIELVSNRQLCIELSTNIHVLAASPLPPDVVAAVHEARSALAVKQSLFAPPSVTVHVFKIFAAVHVARSALAVGQPAFVPSIVTVHVLTTAIFGRSQ